MCGVRYCLHSKVVRLVKWKKRNKTQSFLFRILCQLRKKEEKMAHPSGGSCIPRPWSCQTVFPCNCFTICLDLLAIILVLVFLVPLEVLSICDESIAISLRLRRHILLKCKIYSKIIIHESTKRVRRSREQWTKTQSSWLTET